MKIAVTGGTGFIGNYVVSELISKGNEVIVTGTNLENAKKCSWFDKVKFLECNIHFINGEEIFEELATSDKMIHLIWTGLPNYKELHHFENNLLPQYFFLKKLILLGLKDITITGTCFEYGMKEGPLNNAMPSDPQNPYALAKDTLRKFLQEFQKKENFKLKWLRLFYMYGKGQSEKSILSQLEKALKNGDKVFNMSGGEQLRDYMKVEEVAKLIVDTALDNHKNGIYNICKGKPITIKKLVEDYLLENKKTIQLNLGHYPYLDYEPMAFWGENT